jgi:hypothetical protein
MINNIIQTIIKTWIIDTFIDHSFNSIYTKFCSNNVLPSIGEKFSYIIEIYGDTIYKDCTITNIKENVSKDGNIYYFIFFNYDSAWLEGINVTESLKDIEYDIDDFEDGIGEDEEGLILSIEDDDVYDSFDGINFPNDNLSIRLMEDDENLVGMNLSYMKLVK